MKCEKCGNTVKDGQKFCSSCGAPVQKIQPDEEKKQLPESGMIKKQNHIFGKKKIWIVIGILIILFIVVNLGDKKDTDKVIEKIQSFTSMEKTDSSYVFSTDTWSLKYVESNEFVEFRNNEVYKCFVNCFQTYDLGNEGTFTYDLSEKEIRIYFNCEIPDGKLTIVNYNISSDNFTLIIDGQRYKPTNEFVEFINAYGLVDIMKNDIEAFINELKDRDLSTEKITDLRYKDLVKAID